VDLLSVEDDEEEEEYDDTDPRCLVRLSEMSLALSNKRLDRFLCIGWDCDQITIANRRRNKVSSRPDYTLGLVGDIPPDTLRKIAPRLTEDGCCSRFLWVHTETSRSNPVGGDLHLDDALLVRLKAALTFGKQARLMTRDEQAEKLWSEVYDDLKKCGDAVPQTRKARPNVLRASMIYALADSSRIIRR